MLTYIIRHPSAPRHIQTTWQSHSGSVSGGVAVREGVFQPDLSTIVEEHDDAASMFEGFSDTILTAQ
jgi:hypothetical protein